MKLRSLPGSVSCWVKEPRTRQFRAPALPTALYSLLWEEPKYSMNGYGQLYRPCSGDDLQYFLPPSERTTSKRLPRSGSSWIACHCLWSKQIYCQKMRKNESYGDNAASSFARTGLSGMLDTPVKLYALQDERFWISLLVISIWGGLHLSSPT